MVAKRVIMLDRTHPTSPWRRAVLWADVPAGNQGAYRNPLAVSAYKNASPAELQAIRDGLVAEKVVTHQSDNASLTTIRADFLAQQVIFQAAVTAEIPWDEYGSYYDGAAWQASPGVPLMACCAPVENGDLPGFVVAMTGDTAFAANRFQFVLCNGLSTTLGNNVPIRVRYVGYRAGLAAVTGAAPGPFELRRREGATTLPTGTGGLVITATDSAYPLSTGITAWSNPGTVPAGGTITAVFNSFTPQADELKLSTADAPTLASVLNPFVSQPIYDSLRTHPARPITLRAGQILECVQNATGGTGNCRWFCLFTVG